MATSTKLFTIKKEVQNFKNVKITFSRSAANYARNFYHDDISIYESFFLILLNSHNSTIGYAKISQGGINSTLVDTRILAKYAVEALCPAVILVHNHPSGKLEPSKADKEITQKLKKGLDFLDIKVFDHIIITEDNYFSFADEGIL